MHSGRFYLIAPAPVEQVNIVKPQKRKTTQVNVSKLSQPCLAMLTAPTDGGN
jgi:hypothetical protein